MATTPAGAWPGRRGPPARSARQLVAMAKARGLLGGVSLYDVRLVVRFLLPTALVPGRGAAAATKCEISTRIHTTTTK